MAIDSTKPQDFRLAIRRYADLIAGALTETAPLSEVFAAEDADHLQLERGEFFARFILDPSQAADPPRAMERLIAVASPQSLSRIDVVDRAGHRRPVYRPLLVYAWLQSFRIGYEHLPRQEFGRWEEAARTWCDDLEARLGEFTWPSTQIPAFIGDRAAEICWIALALQVAGKVFIRDAWTDLASDVFGKLIRRQDPGGALLTKTASDNPELLWFHELAILHAAASQSVQTEDRALAASVTRATRYHLNEIQADHGTNQPWALFAFIWNPDTRPVADGLLHSAAAAGASPLTSILLADALYCLRLFK